MHGGYEKCIKKTVTGKTEGKKVHERLSHGVGNNIGMDLNITARCGMDSAD
jgi:hypothetical protein